MGTQRQIDPAVARYMAGLCPASPTELLLVRQRAICKVRQQQAQAAETEAWNRTLAAHDGCLAKAVKTMAESGEWACIMRSAPADPPLRTDSAKRTGMVRVHRTTNEQRRTTNALRQFARDKIPRSPE